MEEEIKFNGVPSGFGKRRVRGAEYEHRIRYVMKLISNHLLGAKLCKRLMQDFEICEPGAYDYIRVATDRMTEICNQSDEDIYGFCKKILTDHALNGQRKDSITATKELAKLTGQYKPVKVEITQNQFDNLTKEQLEEIAKKEEIE